MYINTLFQALTLKYVYVQDFVIFVCVCVSFCLSCIPFSRWCFCQATLLQKDGEIDRLNKALAEQRLLTEEVCQAARFIVSYFFWHRKAPKATVQSFLPNLHDFAKGSMLWHHDSQMILVTPWHVTLDLRWFWGDSWRAHQSFMKFQAWIKD